MGACVDVQRDGTVATVVMHRERNNAIAEDLLTELREAFETLGADPEVRAIVLASGFDRYFSVGADLGAMAGVDRTAPDAQDQVLAMVRRNRDAFHAIASCPRPVVAALNGHALGGGCELAPCCDYRIMVEDERSRIGQPEVGLGIIPGAGGTQRLVRLIGRARALPMLLEGTRLSAREACDVGLVDQAVAPEELDGAVRQLAGRLAAGPTMALAMIKDAVDRGQDLPLDDALEIEGRNFVRAALSDDAAIGVMSFLAKQTPEFRGR